MERRLVNKVLIPGTVIVDPHPEYQGGEAPPDTLAIKLASFVDLPYRQEIAKIGENPQEWGEKLVSYYAKKAEKIIGFKTGADWKLPGGLDRQTFERYFFACCCDGRAVKSKPSYKSSIAYKNLQKIYDELKRLNPAAFERLGLSNPTEMQMYDVILGMSSKFSLNDIVAYLHRGPEKDKALLWGFFVSDSTERKILTYLSGCGASRSSITHLLHCPFSEVLASPLPNLFDTEHTYALSDGWTVTETVDLAGRPIEDVFRNPEGFVEQQKLTYYREGGTKDWDQVMYADGGIVQKGYDENEQLMYTMVHDSDQGTWVQYDKKGKLQKLVIKDPKGQSKLRKGLRAQITALMKYRSMPLRIGGRK